MKKLFVAVALVMGIGTSVFAYNMNPASIETVTTVNDFTPIEVKDLPAAVQEAITKNYADLTIKEASVEAKEDGTKTYKVVLTDKEGTESTVLFSESGEVLKTNATIRIGTLSTIFQIAFDRTSHFCQLTTYLVMTSCL